MAYGELTQLGSSTEYGEAAIVGRWSESLELSVIAASPAFTVDLIYPDALDGIRDALKMHDSWSSCCPFTANFPPRPVSLRSVTGTET